MARASSRPEHVAGTSRPFFGAERKKERRPAPRRPPSPVGNGEAVVAEEVGGLLAVSEEQHAHHAIQGEDGGALRAHGVGHVERPERILADLKGEATD